jgi:integrase
MANESQKLVLRSFLVGEETDGFLRQEAFRLKISKSELLRTCIERYRHGDQPMKTDDSKVWTFADALSGYMTAHQGEIRATTLVNWHRYKRRHLDKLGDIPITELTRANVLAFLEPYWASNSTSIGSMLRSLGERAWDYAAAKDWCSGSNPWDWNLLSKVLAKRPVEINYPAVPYQRLPAVYRRLREPMIHPPGKRGPSAMGARAVRLCILTASRPTEIADMRWPEIDLDKAVWTLPAHRDKENHERRIPLSPEAIDCLLGWRKGDRPVFSENLARDTMGAALRRVVEPVDKDKTVHGTARSAFRDWAGDESEFAIEVIQLCLGHRIAESDRAYYRSDALERRRAVMNAWAQYLLSEINQ